MSQVNIAAPFDKCWEDTFIMDAVCRVEGHCLWCVFEVLQVPQEERADLFTSLNPSLNGSKVREM